MLRVYCISCNAIKARLVRSVIQTSPTLTTSYRPNLGMLLCTILWRLELTWSTRNNVRITSTIKVVYRPTWDACDCIQRSIIPRRHVGGSFNVNSKSINQINQILFVQQRDQAAVIINQCAWFPYSLSGFIIWAMGAYIDLPISHAASNNKLKIINVLD